MGVAQAVRVPDCGSGGRGFKSHHPPHITLGRSQAVRQRALDPLLVGSNPAAPAKKNDRKTGGRFDPLAQLVEHLTFNQGVPRSSRGWVTKKIPWCKNYGVFVYGQIPAAKFVNGEGIYDNMYNYVITPGMSKKICPVFFYIL